MENFKFANDYIAQNNLQNTLQAIAIKEFAICLDSQVINKPVQTTKEQPIDFDKLSKTKQDLLLTCYYAIQCIDDSKVKPLEIDIEEEAAVTTRQLIEIRNGSIDFGVKVNNIDVIDENIEW